MRVAFVLLSAFLALTLALPAAAQTAASEPPPVGSPAAETGPVTPGDSEAEAEAAPEAEVETAIVVISTGSAEVTEGALSQARAGIIATTDGDRDRHERQARPEREPGLTMRASECEDEACFAALGRDAMAAFLIVVQLQVVDSGHSGSVMLVDVAGQTILGSALLELPAEPAGFVQVFRESLAPLVQAIPSITPTIGSLLVECDQEGAEVFIGDASAGRTPLEEIQELPVGDHQVRVVLEEFDDFERTVTIMPAASTTLAVQMFPATPDEPPPPVVAPATPIWRQWWFWTIVGVAAAGVAVGIAVPVGLSGSGDGETEWGVPFPVYSER